MNITPPSIMRLGGWCNNYRFVGDMVEVRLSDVARSADWIRLGYENQKPWQTLVGNLVQPGSTFSVDTTALTIDIPVTITETIPDPVFTRVPSTTSWDGRTPMTVTATIKNLAAMQKSGFGTLDSTWAVSGVAVIKHANSGTLTLTCARGSGPMTVSLTIDNGGAPATATATTAITVQEPASDPWVERTPGEGNVHGIYANLYKRVTGARLSHGIRGLFWHQGEQNQGAGGIDCDYDYKFYQHYFVDISAAWKQDFPKLRTYYLFQIWPAACGDTSRNDQLREVQRTLPRLYSHMKIMSTHGIVPGSGCHYVPEGHQRFSDLIGPLVEQDVYGVKPAAKLTAANLKQARFTSAAKNEIALVFDQDVAWNPGAGTMFFLADAAGDACGSVTSGSASGNTITLQASDASTAAAITYLKGLVPWQQANILSGSNGIAVLTFADVPIGSHAGP